MQRHAGTTWRTVLVAAACGLAGCREADLQVVRATTEVREAPDPQARSRETLMFAQRVRAADLPFWRPRAWAKRVDGEGFLARADLAPLPLKGEPCYVVTDGTPIRPPAGLPGAAGVARGALALGDKLDAVFKADWLEDGRVALLRDGTIRGFVDASAVSPMVPPLPPLVAALQQQVLRRRFDAVEKLARNAVALHPGEPTPRRLLAELLRRRDEGDEADALLKDLPPLPSLPELPGAAPAVFKAAWVHVDEVVVRDRPAIEGTVLDTLRTNHPVAVLAFSETWAQVRVNLGATIEFDPFGKGPFELPGGRQVTGWLPGWALSQRATDEAVLLSRAAAAQKAGKHADAVVLHGRALSIQPRESTEKALVEASFAAGRFDVMLRWLDPARMATEQGKAPRRAVLLQGCAGDVTRAAYLNGANDRGISSPLHEFGGIAEAVKERALCVTGLDLRPPCEPRYVAPTDCSRFINDDDCAVPARAEHQARLKEFNSRVMPGHNANRKALEKKLGYSPAYLRFNWRDLLETLPDAPPGRADTLTFFAVPVRSVRLADCQGGGVLDLEDAVVHAIPRPMMLGASARHVFVRVPDAYGHEYGAALADEAEVRAWLARRPARWSFGGRTDPVGRPVDGVDPVAPFPVVFVRGLIERDCDAWCVD